MWDDGSQYDNHSCTTGKITTQTILTWSLSLINLGNSFCKALARLIFKLLSKSNKLKAKIDVGVPREYYLCVEVRTKNNDDLGRPIEGPRRGPWAITVESTGIADAGTHATILASRAHSCGVSEIGELAVNNNYKPFDTISSIPAALGCHMNLYSRSDSSVSMW